MEIARVAYGSDWPLAEVFGSGADGGGRGASGRTTSSRWISSRPTVCCLPPGARPSRWRRAGTPEPVDATELAAMLKPGGAFSTAFPGYEFRPPQVDMLEAVAGAFNQGHHLMVEAGTGTGKSVAYLLPAIAYAAKNNTRVVISTNTINLPGSTFPQRFA